MKLTAEIACVLLFFLLPLCAATAAQAAGEYLFACPPPDEGLELPAPQNPPRTCAIAPDAQQIRNGSQLRTGTTVRCPTTSYVCLPEGCLLQYNFVSEKAPRIVRYDCPASDPACLCREVCGPCAGQWQPR